MDQDPRSSAWLLLAAGENRQYGGNSGYEDQADVFYSWDSTVKNHERINVGDRIALWDKKRLLGVSVIEEITTSQSEKMRFRCPECRKANIGERSTLTPRYKCQKCKAVFDKPEVEVVPVTVYQSRHDAAWTSFDGVLGGDDLRNLCYSPKSQHSMRDLDWQALERALTTIGPSGSARAMARINSRSPHFINPQIEVEFKSGASGHTSATVRVRRGQRQFRDYLLKRFGEKCAFTGPAPKRVLEAGHLYSYAQLGEHHEHGGLMLRRDIHRLFDDGGLAVDPRSLTVDVSSSLEPYDQYTELHGGELQVDLQDQHVDWLRKHWLEHRPADSSE